MLRIHRTQTRLCTLLLIGTLWTASASFAQMQDRIPLPQIPAAAEPPIPVPTLQTPTLQTPMLPAPQGHAPPVPLPQIPLPQTLLPPVPASQPDASGGTVAYTLTRTQPARLLEIIRGLCGHRFTVESHYHGTFNTNYNNIPRQTMLRVNPQSNVVHLFGDKHLCDQAYQLIAAIDQPLPQGRKREIIPYQRTPLDVLIKMFEAHRHPQQNNNVVRLIDPTSHPNPIQQVQLEGGLGGGLDSGMVWQGGMGMQSAPLFGSPNVIGVPEGFQYMFIPEFDVIIVEAEGVRLNRFIEIIRQLEDLSLTNRPRIEVVYLKHINNVSLASPQQGILAQIYQTLFGTVPGTAMMSPMYSPNAVMLTGWGEAMEVAKELIQALDQPTLREHSRLHIFKLKHISALQARNVVQGAFPVIGGFPAFAERVQVFHEPRSNSLIVQGAPNEIEEVKRILHEIDVDKPEFKLQMTTIMLKNSLAADVADSLRNAITGTATDGKVPAFDLLVRGPEGQRLIQSGILTDVNISTDPRNNQIIIRAPEGCMEFIEELVRILDVASPEAEVRIFRIENGDAESLLSMLRTLILSNLDGEPGVQLPNTTEGDALIPIRLAVDRRTNSIIAAGSPGDLLTIEALIASLDGEDMLSRKIHVYHLKNMQAANVADTISAYLQDRLTLQSASGVISPFHQLESAAIVVADTESNSLIIGATPRHLDEILELIDEIDRSPPQVVIRVLIAEVTLSEDKEWAAELGLQDPIFFRRGSTLNFNNTDALPSGTTNPGANTGTVASQLLSNFGGVARSASGGLVFGASSEYINIMIRALQAEQRLEVLSAPQIATMNNQRAIVSVGQLVPRSRGMQTFAQGDTRMDISDQQVDMALEIVPTISPEGTIVMGVVLKKDKIGGDVPVGNQRLSTVDTTNLVTMVSAANNQTVVLGGLITNEVTKDRKKIPLLGDIPVVGKMFRHEIDKSTRKELLVILTPRIVDSREDLDHIRQLEMARMSWCRQHVADVYGDIDSYSITSERPYTGNVPIIRPGHVKIETLQRLESQPYIAPTLPRRD